MRRKQSSLPTFFVMLAALSVFGGILWANAQSAERVAPILPTEAPATDSGDVVAQLLSDNFGRAGTPIPTVALPTLRPTQPLIAAVLGPTATPVSASALGDGSQVASVSGVTPTQPPPTVVVTAQSSNRDASNWRPPPLVPPLSLDPLGRDHYWFYRPVKSNANNSVLAFYSYGATGSGPNPNRVHHGIDMPNPIGEEVLAAGDGVVVFAADGRLGDTQVFDNSVAYGNVVQIRHDFGYRGQAVYTLYAHLSASIVREGDRVQAGQVIGLIGDSGSVTGPHIHFEVRVGENRYGSTYNPILWMVPYDGHGVIAGRITDANGELIDNALITIRNWATGLQHATTTSYVFNNTVNDVNPDPVWQENFVVPDVPAGRYDIIATINGQRVIRQVDVLTGRTSFAELKPPEADPTVTPSVNTEGEASTG